jgi:hypothetical protein
VRRVGGRRRRAGSGTRQRPWMVDAGSSRCLGQISRGATVCPRRISQYASTASVEEAKVAVPPKGAANTGVIVYVLPPVSVTG